MDDKLRWLQYNRRNWADDLEPPRPVKRGYRRRRHRGPTAIGPLAQDILALPQATSTLVGQVWSLLNEYGGAELTQWVTVVGVNKGVLTLEVAEPAVMYHLRMQWRQRIQEIMNNHLPEAGVHAVRFRQACQTGDNASGGK